MQKTGIFCPMAEDAGFFLHHVIPVTSVAGYARRTRGRVLHLYHTVPVPVTAGADRAVSSISKAVGRTLSESSLFEIKSTETGIDGTGPQGLLDPEKLVVLRDAFRPGGRTGLDLAGVQGHCEVRDRGVLGAGSVEAVTGEKPSWMLTMKSHTRHGSWAKSCICC